MSRWKFTPIYRKCPRCDLDFSKHFIDSGEYKKYAENVEADTKKTILSWVTFTHEIVGKTISLNDYSLKWMINPLPEADEKTANGNKRSWCGWKFWKVTGAGHNEDNNAGNHDNLVPVVKRKLREQIFHYFLGRDSF